MNVCVNFSRIVLVSVTEDEQCIDTAYQADLSISAMAVGSRKCKEPNSENCRSSGWRLEIMFFTPGILNKNNTHVIILD